MHSIKMILRVTTCFCVASPLTFGAITYDVVPRDGKVSRWSLDGGTITTDGMLGEVSPQNFLKWELRFSSPSGKLELSSESGRAFLRIFSFANTSTPQPAPSLTATEEHLVANPGEGLLILAFATQDVFSDNFTGNAVGYSPQSGNVRLVNGVFSGGILIDNSIDTDNPIGLFTSTGGPNQSTFPTPSGPLVIGSVVSVPEPSSLFLLMVFSSCVWLPRKLL